MHGTNAESCQYILWHVTRAVRGVSQIFHLLFLGNGWTDCVEILYAVGVPLVTSYLVVICGASARAHVHIELLYLRNGLADCVQIWCGVWSHYLSALHKS